ncbi:hypothetical protein JYT93_00160 [bacterium AH-315-J19]|nr:hypothetical protein [bacterium AH-315-J19]MBN4058427.1 hypothetical protein [bacterium AH-315-J19]
MGVVSGETGDKIINAFAWVIEAFTEKHGLPEEILYPESEVDFYKTVPPGDHILQMIWAGKRFLHFKDWFAMAKWPLNFAEEPDELVTRRKGRTQQNRLTKIHAARHDEKYYVDDYGCPVIYYCERQLQGPGYINYRIINRLADMLHKTGPKPVYIQETPNRELTIICGAFMGMGHLFCTRNRGHRKLFSWDGKENYAAFALAVYLQICGFNKARAFKQFGHLFSIQTKKDLKIAFRQLCLFKPAIKDLRKRMERNV